MTVASDFHHQSTLDAVNVYVAPVQRDLDSYMTLASDSHYHCCIRICSAMVGVPHRPLLPSILTGGVARMIAKRPGDHCPCPRLPGRGAFSYERGTPVSSGGGGGRSVELIDTTSYQNDTHDHGKSFKIIDTTLSNVKLIDPTLSN